MIERIQNIACVTLAEEADKTAAWKDYARYCRLRDQGLRRQAFSSLDEFIAAALVWDFEHQMAFVLWLCSRMDTLQDAHQKPFPEPLRTRLFLPFFTEWLCREPANDEAHALRARYLEEPSLYRRAVEINPRNQRARIALAEACVQGIAFAMHHLPDHFIGDEQEAKLVAKEAKDHLAHIEQTDRRTRIAQDLAYEEQMLDDWIAFQQESGGGFDAWCRSKGRSYSWLKAYYYDQ
jgi:hypothetical protein